MSSSKDPRQPFPSPGSSFIPPPVLGPHEYALRRNMSKIEVERSTTPTQNGIDTGTSPNGVDLPSTPSDPPDPQLSLPPTPTHRLSTHSHTSLTSSRPAPPSPAISRRASGLSRTSSRPVSGTSSRPPSGLPHSRRTSGILAPTTPIGMTAITSTPKTPRPLPHLTPTTPDAPTTKLPTPISTSALPTTSVFIQIRDYGFAQTDPRFTGLGPNVPRANRPTILARRLAASSKSTRTSSSEGDNGEDDDDYEDEDGEEDEGERMNVDGAQGMWQDDMDDGVNGWPGFKWGFGHGWGFRPMSVGTGFPSRGDLDRNFGGEDEQEDMEIEEVLSDEDGLGDGESELPLSPGIYRALYAFEPEGTAEMKLDEDQLVRVIGRGGGVGWAVVVKNGLKDTGVHALVPESYLELVRVDGEDEDLDC